VDEIWSFVGCKKANVKPEHNADYGDAWTFVCIDADTKLVPSWYVGQRDADDAYTVLNDLRGRLTNRMQLSTDGHQMYLSATAETFGEDLDYAMVVKKFKSQPKPENVKYSPEPSSSSPSRRSPARRTRRTSPRRSWSGRTSRSACPCGGSPGSRTRSARRLRT
jgi:hypothetical protein